jgi:epoxide hydrolase-like predicted phosphatase
MTIRALIFDYGDVLDTLDDIKPWLDRRDQLAAQFDLTGDAMWQQFYTAEPWQLVKKGRITNAEFWNRTLSPFGIIDPQAQAAFVAQLFEGRERVHSEMADLLRELKPRYKLAILSNTYEPAMDTWLAEAQGLPDIFDVVVSSANVGMAKPEPEIYQLTLDRLGVAPHEALFIDDKTRNTTAAEALGIASILFESPAQLRRELTARGILGE